MQSLIRTPHLLSAVPSMLLIPCTNIFITVYRKIMNKSENCNIHEYIVANKTRMKRHTIEG